MVLHITSSMPYVLVGIHLRFHCNCSASIFSYSIRQTEFHSAATTPVLLHGLKVVKQNTAVRVCTYSRFDTDRDRESGGFHTLLTLPDTLIHPHTKSTGTTQSLPTLPRGLLLAQDLTCPQTLQGFITKTVPP